MWLWNLQSSNAFASGANQNSGNFITGRPSTRVNAHGQSSGGGASQWSIGGFTDAPADAPQSSNAFASGSNQNSGNVLTDRASTRVVREPGGASQWSIGGFTDAPAQAGQYAGVGVADGAPDTGNNAWVGMAFAHYAAAAEDACYSLVAHDILEGRQHRGRRGRWRRGERSGARSAG